MNTIHGTSGDDFLRGTAAPDATDGFSMHVRPHGRTAGVSIGIPAARRIRCSCSSTASTAS